MEFFKYLLTMLTGVAAGFLNVTAGGGSLLVLPVLVLGGMDMSIANGTNRVAILFQNIVAIRKFRKEGVLSLKDAVFFTIPAAIGSVAGSFLAVNLDEQVLRIVISVLILTMAFLLIAKPAMWEKQSEQKFPSWLLFSVFFFIGVYGGFIQAGVGFFLLWGLVGLAGNDLLRSNALKASIIGFYTLISLAIFMFKGMVDLQMGLALAVGNMTGGYLGARFSIAKGNVWLRWILVTVVTISALKMIAEVIFS